MGGTDAPTSAVAVANAFLNIAGEDGTAVDQMKLQKLVFYAHAWWLADKGQALFDDDVEAWPWGPVVRDVYLQFKDFGRKPIGNTRAKELVRTGSGVLDYKVVAPDTPDEKVMDFLREVWKVHKDYSGVQLSNATHAPGEPWDIVKKEYGSLDEKPRIPNSLIRDVFRSKLNTGKETAG